MSAIGIFKDAWKNRDQLGDSQHTRELAAFLPAALEIQQSPQNPIAKWLGRSLLILFTLAIIWACVGKINIVASAEGKIIPSSRVKHIQPLEKAVVKDILVTEGQYVAQGQALIELDSALTSADQNRLTGELHSAQLKLVVNQALLTLLDKQSSNSITAPGKQKQPLLTRDKLTLPKKDLPENVTTSELQLHKSLLWQQWQQYITQQNTLESTLIQTRAEQGATQAVIKKLKQTLPIIKKRTAKMQQLMNKKFVSETEYLQLEQQRIEATQDLAAEKQRLKQLEAAEAEVQQQINSFIAQTSAEKLTEITESQRQIAALQEELIKATDLNAKQILYSPVSGRVQELSINTVGGVVTEAQQLMLIVPDSEQLEVEVFLENKDIGFVHEDMTAEIKIHTFPFTKYGVIDGEVTTISDDATLDEQRGLIYGMHLLMKNNTLWVEGKKVKLIPGMAVTAEMQTGERRIIEFFLAPLLRHGKEGLRER